MLETLIQWLIAILAIALGTAIGLVLFVGIAIALLYVLFGRNRRNTRDDPPR